MADHSAWEALWRGAAASSLLSAAAFGAAGGLTSALSITGQSRRDVIRQVVLGALVAGGLGTAAGGVLAAWLGLPAGAIPAVGVGGAASYLSGVFGPALFEVVLGRIRAGRLPGEPPGRPGAPPAHRADPSETGGADD